jgi:hypothetical protein
MFLALSAFGFSQSAQQPVQPSNVINNMAVPPTNNWMQIIMPMFVGVSTLFGVYLTSKFQVNLERTKEEIAAQSKNRDNLRTLYRNLYNSITDCIWFLEEIHLLQMEHITHRDDDWTKKLDEYHIKFLSALVTLNKYANHALVDTTNNLVLIINNLREQLPNIFESESSRIKFFFADFAPFFQYIKILEDTRNALSVASSKDLWDSGKQVQHKRGIE